MNPTQFAAQPGQYQSNPVRQLIIAIIIIIIIIIINEVIPTESLRRWVDG
jgi:hypothetical protein